MKTLTAVALLVVIASTGHAQQQAQPRYLNSLPVYSPDGGLVAFVSTRDGQTDLYVASADGSSTRRVTNSPEQEGRPTWGPDGSLLIFDIVSRVDNRRVAKPFAVDLNGANLRPFEQAGGSGLALSVGGMVAMGKGEWPMAEMHIQASPGNPSARVSPEGFVGFWPSWSRDGSLLAFTLLKPDNVNPQRSVMGIAVVRADGTALRRVLPDSIPAETAAWFPSGDRFAFQSRKDGNYDIWSVRVDGSELRKLTTHPGLDEVPSVSADGMSIVFQSDRTGEVDLWVMNADGTNVRKFLKQ